MDGIIELLRFIKTAKDSNFTACISLNSQPFISRPINKF